MTEANAGDVKSLSFEAALDELEKIVAQLEQANVPLEDSIRIYERGEALKAHCQTLLKAAEDKVQKIQVGADGSAKGAEPLDT